MSRRVRLILLLVLLGALAGTVALAGPALVSSLRSAGLSPPWGSECTVETSNGPVGLSREQARRATTAVALTARGAAAPDVADLPAAALERLVEGPPDDAGPSLSCRGAVPPDLEEQSPTATGLTPRAQRVREAMDEVFGKQSVGGFAPGGVDRGHGGDSTHYSGRAVDVFFRPVTQENRQEGWRLAHWLVAHAPELEVQYVIFDDQFWSARGAQGRWRAYDAPTPANEILRHLDHVHVDVFRGDAH